MLALASLLEHMLTSVVDEPESVAVTCSKDAHSVYLDFSTERSDTKFVVGHKGLMLSALERVVYSAARSRGVRVKMHLAEDQLKMGGGPSR